MFLFSHPTCCWTPIVWSSCATLAWPDLSTRSKRTVGIQRWRSTWRRGGTERLRFCSDLQGTEINFRVSSGQHLEKGHLWESPCADKVAEACGSLWVQSLAGSYQKLQKCFLRPACMTLGVWNWNWLVASPNHSWHRCHLPLTKGMGQTWRTNLASFGCDSHWDFTFFYLNLKTSIFSKGTLKVLTCGASAAYWGRCY